MFDVGRYVIQVMVIERAREQEKLKKLEEKMRKERLGKLRGAA